MLQVRDLRAEELDRLLEDSPPARIRFLVQACEALARSGEGDVVVLGDADGRFTVAAAGYQAPFGEATIVLAPVRGANDDLRRLLAALEARSVARHCVGLVGAVDAPDLAARRLLESLGYELSGAGVVVWTEDADPGAVPRRADVWRLRKTISDGTLPSTPDEEDTCSSD